MGGGGSSFRGPFRSIPEDVEMHKVLIIGAGLAPMSCEICEAVELVLPPFTSRVRFICIGVVSVNCLFVRSSDLM
jgi:hypothetical protein